MIDLSICIVSFNTRDILRNCLNSIFESSKDISFEILVFDNNSSDGSAKMIEKEFPQVLLKKSSENLLWSPAINKLLKKIKGKYFLTLNPDTEIPHSALKKMIIYLDNNPRISLASCRQVDDSGNFDPTCSLFPTPIMSIFHDSLIGSNLRKIIYIKQIEKILNSYDYKGWKRNTIRETEVISGAFMIGRKEVFKLIGYFDENLQLFYEEADFCKRAKEKGLKIFHNGKVSIVHLKSRSLLQISPFLVYKISENNMLYYYKKHFNYLWFIILWLFFRPNWLLWKLKSIIENYKNAL